MKGPAEMLSFEKRIQAVQMHLSVVISTELFLNISFLDVQIEGFERA